MESPSATSDFLKGPTSATFTLILALIVLPLAVAAALVYLFADGAIRL